MTTRMSKTEKVLDFLDLDKDGDALYYQRGTDLTTLWPLSKADYEDMGSPKQITVTILPGDLLNTGEAL